MKKLFNLCTHALILGLVFCSSSNNGTSDPTKTAQEFSNPTGDLTSTNATQVCRGGIYGLTVVLFGDPDSIFSNFTVPNECKETSGDTVTIDWGCSFNNVTGCNGDGKSETTDDDQKDFISNTYIDFAVDCSGSGGGDDVTISCDGTSNTSRDNNYVFCADLTCTVDGDKKTFHGCKNSDGYTLVRLEDDTFVVRQMQVNPGCTQATFTIRDKNNTNTVVCDVDDSESPCTTASDVSEISNCKIQ